MKPYPRIRKTAKWAGAAATVLLVVVWFESLALIDTWSYGPTDYVQVSRGVARFIHRAKGVEQVGFEVLRPPGIMIPEWSIRWTNDARGWALRVPLWPLICAVVVCTAAAWRLDSLARRRARQNLCPKCHYNRAGLPTNAVCPECGTPAPCPSPAPSRPDRLH